MRADGSRVHRHDGRLPTLGEVMFHLSGERVSVRGMDPSSPIIPTRSSYKKKKPKKGYNVYL